MAVHRRFPAGSAIAQGTDEVIQVPQGTGAVHRNSFRLFA
jgi:hypothetical protein